MGQDASILATARGKLAVRLGVIDEDAEYAYTNGQCIALVLALSTATGWPIVCHLSRPGDLWWEEKTHGRKIKPAEATEGWFYNFVHALVLSPDRWLLDIRGEHDLDSYRDEALYDYGSSALVMVDAPTLRAALADALKNGAKHMLQDERVAGTFAATILADYNAARHGR